VVVEWKEKTQEGGESGERQGPIHSQDRRAVADGQAVTGRVGALPKRATHWSSVYFSSIKMIGL
jgi:hypothetical protein